MNKQVWEAIHDYLNSNDGNDTFNQTDDILALSEMKEMMEKAEKWNKLVSQEWKQILSYGRMEIIERVLGFDLLMKDLVVEEKCPQCDKGRVIPELEKSYDCDYCNATGTITRPAKAEEVRQTLEYPDDWEYRNGRWEYLLSSGAILRMEAKQ